jgi:hypothetical protein
MMLKLYVLTYSTPPDVILDRLLSHSKQTAGPLYLKGGGGYIMACVFPKIRVTIRREGGTP